MSNNPVYRLNTDEQRALKRALIRASAPNTQTTTTTELRQLLATVYVEDGDGSDNLWIAICSYFDGHIKRPIDDPTNEHGWGEWAAEKTDRAIDRIAAALADKSNGWIKVSERLPEPHARVLCKSDFSFVGGYEPDKQAFSLVNDVYVPVAEVKLWQPLPPLPKEET